MHVECVHFPPTPESHHQNRLDVQPGQILNVQTTTPNCLMLLTNDRERERELKCFPHQVLSNVL